MIGKENKDGSAREAQIKDGGFNRKGEVDESSKKAYLYRGRMSEDGRRCTRTRTLGDSAFSVGVNLPSPPPSPLPLSCESLALLFPRVRRVVGCEGVRAGVGKVRGSDFGPI